MTIVPLRTPAGNIPAEADEIIGCFAIVNLSQVMPGRRVYFGISHVASGWGFAAFDSIDIAIRLAWELGRHGLDWDSIYARVDAGQRMDSMLERDTLVMLYRRSFHDSHSLIPLGTASYMPDEIIEEVEAHRIAMMGDAN